MSFQGEQRDHSTDQRNYPINLISQNPPASTSCRLLQLCTGHHGWGSWKPESRWGKSADRAWQSNWGVNSKVFCGWGKELWTIFSISGGSFSTDTDMVGKGNTEVSPGASLRVSWSGHWCFSHCWTLVYPCQLGSNYGVSFECKASKIEQESNCTWKQRLCPLTHNFTGNMANFF